MVRLGIIGCNFGRTVHLPAFRNDPRCEVVALAGTDAARTDALAREAGVRLAFGDWRALLDHDGVDAVAIAVPPSQQPEIAMRALAAGQPGFLGKPLAPRPPRAQAGLRPAPPRPPAATAPLPVSHPA